MAKCAVCGRKLTDPASIAAGVGPVCAGKQQKQKRKRHPLIVGAQTSASTVTADAPAPALNRVPLANGEPMSKEEALAVIDRIFERARA